LAIEPDEDQLKMATLLTQDAQVKCTIDSDFSLQSSIQKCGSSTNLLITENANFVILWDSRSNSSSKSWAFPSFSPLTCPMMCDPFTERLVAVRRHQSLTVFKPTDDLSQIEEIALLPHMRVQCVLSDRQRLYVWLDSGEVYPLNQLLRICGHSLPEDHSMQDLLPVKPLFRFAPHEKIERILDVPSFNRQSSLGFLISSNGERFVNIYTFNSDQVVKTKIPLLSNEIDVVCGYDHLIVIEHDYRVFAVRPESRTFLFDLSPLATENQIVRLKYLLTGKNLR
jgi:hypothetical protein